MNEQTTNSRRNPPLVRLRDRQYLSTFFDKG